ncbi:hypothetical protein [Flavobacterium sp. PL02]|uniref:hypothetical protein n=1 Tax=Flavobacterium sp. PL02 TaxID=3088354 RepID=UPI002B2378ED|nr:hypothetical protein [Flavobacterium sp. PL02]MEA9414688.1 hypothetical protein [Flavobacterium sp. PL02]
MKKLILLFFFAIGLNSAHAECGVNGMQFFPKKTNISLNSMFIIQGYYMSEKTINSFKNRTAYLQSKKGELVKLNLVEILKGQMSLTQAIFKPAKQLKPNTIYFLKYSKQTERETEEMTQWNTETNQNEKVYWKTTNKNSAELLNPNLKIKYQKTEVREYGCGPAANAIFNVTNKSDSEIWYKTEMVDLNTNQKTVFYIKEWDGKLNVGHGMCSGAFTFTKLGKYKVRFTPMNTDGKSLNTTKWINFESPFRNDKSSS